MSGSVKTRSYDSTRRREAAERTRLRILAAARDLFLTRGYEATPIAEIARRAATSVDTVYAAVGRKPELLLAVHDMELANASAPVSARQRDYVKTIEAAGSAAEKLQIYAQALAQRLPRTVPLMEAMREAGRKDPACRAVYDRLSARRLQNMGEFARDLIDTGEIREELAPDDIARLVWSMNSPEYFRLLTESGATAEGYAAVVSDVWIRTFVRSSHG